MVIIRICGALREQSWSDLTEAEFSTDYEVKRFWFQLRSAPDTAGLYARRVSKVLACRARWRNKGRA